MQRELVSIIRPHLQQVLSLDSVFTADPSARSRQAQYIATLSMMKVSGLAWHKTPHAGLEDNHPLQICKI